MKTISSRVGLSLLALLVGCGGSTSQPDPAVTGETPPATVTTPSSLTALVASTGACGATPKKLVDPSSFPAPTDAGPINVNASNITVGGGNVYYVTDAAQDRGPLEAGFVSGEIFQVPVVGGTPTSVASGSFFNDLAVTSTSLVVTAGNLASTDVPDRLLSIPLAGGPAQTLATLGNNVGAGYGLVTDGTNVYFGDSDGVQEITIPSAAGAPASAPVTLSNAVPNGLALAGRALFVSANVSTMTTVTGTLTRIALPGGTTDALAPPGAHLLFACGADVCWFDTTQLTEPNGDTTSTLMRLAPSDTTPVALLDLGPDEAYTNAVVFDGTDFFVTTTDQTGGNAQILRIPSDGSAAVPLVKGATGGLAFDDTCIYWGGDDGIFSIAKTAIASE